jgi:hypothetical protein
MPVFDEDVKIERNGSPKLSIQSRGNGTQHYSIRATNDDDAAGGSKFIIRNESRENDMLTIDNRGNIDVQGDIRLSGADCAENFDISESTEIEPGTVLVINKQGKLQECTDAYDKKVAGIVSGAGDYKPGIVLDKKTRQKNRMPVALMGKVYCKVDAQYAPIEIGDLLTSSPTPGYAMKAEEPLKAFGSVIGKALQNMRSGHGLIQILVSLQ